MLFSVGSKFLGFFREVLIANYFGSTFFTDAFYLALGILALFKVMLTATISTTLIPILAKINDNEIKMKFISNLKGLSLGFSILIIIAVYLLAETIVSMIGIGLNNVQIEFVAKLVKIGIWVVIFSAAAGINRGYFQSEGSFTESAITDLPFNLVYIFYLIFFSSIYGIEGLMVASVLAVVSQVLLQQWTLRKLKFKYVPHINIKDEYIINIIKLAPPILFSVSIIEINNLIDKMLATKVSEGVVSALAYSSRVNLIIISLFIVIISTVLFPLLSQKVQKKDYEELNKITTLSINSIVILMTPIMFFVFNYSYLIIELLFERGAFIKEDTLITSEALKYYSIGLLAFSLRTFLDKVFYSFQDTKTPFINSFFLVVINIILSIVLVKYFEHKGLAFATSLAAIITTFWLLYRLKSKLKSFRFRPLTIIVITSIAIHIVWYELLNICTKDMDINLGIYFIINMFFVIIYFLILKIFKVKEIEYIYSGIVKKLKKRKKVL